MMAKLSAPAKVETIAAIPAGKIRCFVTETLRAESPEEHVRQRMARSLVEEYGYSKADIALEFPIQLGSSKKRADIVIFSPGALHSIENIFIVVEAKRDSIKPTDRDNGEAQLVSYLSACLNLLTEARHLIYQALSAPSRIEDDDVGEGIEEKS